MTPTYLARRAAASWNQLSVDTTTAAAPGFDPGALGHLPEPVARWLRHTIAPDAPLRLGATLDMTGSIRIGGWRPFTAQQVISPTGYVWAAEAGRFPLVVRGFDRFSGGTGEMRWRLLGLIPVVRASGPDVTRSAAGRLASEIIGLTPGGALAPGVTWRQLDENRATATVKTGSFVHHVTVNVDDRGALRSLSLPRWGHPDKGEFGLHPFGVTFRGETTFGAYTIPTVIRAGWWFDTPRWDEGEFFRCAIERAVFR